MNPSAESISYLVAVCAFLALTALLLASRQTGRHGLFLVFASACSLVWAGAGFWTARHYPGSLVGAGMLDMLRMVTWGLFVHSVILLGRRSPAAANDERNRGDRVLDGWRYPILAAVLILAQGAVQFGVEQGLIAGDRVSVLLPALWIITALTALVMVEELYRNTTPDRRYAIRHVCLGLGAMFAFDFFIFTDTLLFRRIEPDLWNVRGFLYAAAVPLIGLSVARNRDWALRLHVSRDAVTGSAVVLGAGAYLLATAVAGSLIRIDGVSWSSVSGTAFLVLACAAMAILVVSKRTRSRTRVFLTKHLFSYKYDYRREWLKFTDTLATDSIDAPASIIKALTAIVESTTGAIWGRTNDGRLELLATRGLSGLERIPASSLRSLEHFMSATGWIIDLDELRAQPDRYPDLELPPVLLDNATYWLIVPLPFHDEVVGMALIGRSILMKRIIWEDRDLLRTAGHQAAVLLAQGQSQRALGEAKQFEGFSKLSAYIVHDIKNILGQQSLIVSNAEKHKHKPAFVDDAIETIDNSVKRMQGLLEQLRSEKAEGERVSVELAKLLWKAIALRQGTSPAPRRGQILEGLFVQADRDKTLRVIGHLIQNAQEATPADGTVEVSLTQLRDTALIRISDTGHGMSEAFIRERLFRPFESTKGLTGMGIGVYESREHARALGGDLTVESTVGAGSVFTIELPAVNAVLTSDDTQDVVGLTTVDSMSANEPDSRSIRESAENRSNE